MSYELPLYYYWCIPDRLRTLWLYFFSIATLEIGNWIETPFGWVVVVSLLSSARSNLSGISPMMRAIVYSEEHGFLNISNFNEPPPIQSLSTLVFDWDVSGYGPVYAAPFRSQFHYIQPDQLITRSHVRLNYRTARSGLSQDPGYSRAVVSNIGDGARFSAIRQFVDGLVPLLDNDMSYRVLTEFCAHVGIFYWPSLSLPIPDWLGWREFPWGRVRMRQMEGGVRMPGTNIIWFVVEDMEVSGMQWEVQHGVLGVPNARRRSTRGAREIEEVSAREFTQELMRDVAYTQVHGLHIRNTWIRVHYLDETVWDW